MEPNIAAEKSAAEKKTTEPAPEKRTGNASNAAKPTAEPKPGTVREKAAVGMGEKGRGYGRDMTTVPLMAMWAVKERLLLARSTKP